jgi:hypothetical protein
MHIDEQSIVVQIGKDSPVAIFYLADRLVELLEFDLFFLAPRVQYTVLAFLHPFVFFYFEDLAHLKLFVFEFLQQVINLFHLWILRIERIKVVSELVRFVSETKDADSGVLGNSALSMIRVAAAEMQGLFSAREGITTGFAIRSSVVAVQLLIVVQYEYLLQTDLNEIGSNV